MPKKITPFINTWSCPCCSQLFTGKNLSMFWDSITTNCLLFIPDAQRSNTWPPCLWQAQTVALFGAQWYHKYAFTDVAWLSGVWSECPSAWMPQSQCPYCLVAMPQSQSCNVPTAKSQCTHILEHCGCNAPLLDGMPHIRDSRFFNVRITTVLLSLCVPIVLVSSGNIIYIQCVCIYIYIYIYIYIITYIYK